MTDTEHRSAAAKFAGDWKGRWDEKQETQAFWLTATAIGTPSLPVSIPRQPCRQSYTRLNKAMMQQEYSGIMGGSNSFTIIGASGIGKSSVISGKGRYREGVGVSYPLIVISNLSSYLAELYSIETLAFRNSCIETRRDMSYNNYTYNFLRKGGGQALMSLSSNVHKKAGLI